jgi:hypothetical protein
MRELVKIEWLKCKICEVKTSPDNLSYEPIYKDTHVCKHCGFINSKKEHTSIYSNEVDTFHYYQELANQINARRDEEIEDAHILSVDHIRNFDIGVLDISCEHNNRVPAVEKQKP